MIRRRIQNSVVVLLAAAAFYACASVTANGQPEIRLRNATNINFDSIRVVFPKDEVRYGELRAGATSSFHAVKEAYRYAFIEAFADTVRYVQQPIDYVGESLLDEGRYTYRIELPQPGTHFLATTLIEE